MQIRNTYLPQIEIAGRILIILYFIGIIISPIYFARLHIAPILYATDFLLISISLIILYKLISKKLFTPPRFLIAYIGIILLYSSFELISGLIHYNNPVYSLRQFAPFLYMLFIPICYYLYDTHAQIKTLLISIFSTTTLTAIIYLSTGFQSSVYAYVSWGIGVSIALYLYNIEKYKWLVYLGFFIILLSIFATSTRGGWLGIAITLISAIILVKILIKDKFYANSTKGILVIIITLISCIPLSFFFSTASEKSIIEARWANILQLKTSEEFNISHKAIMGGVVNNPKWRLYIWQDTLEDWEQKPILGYGFGRKFFSKTIDKLGWAGSQNDKSIWEGKNIGLEPHNSHLHVLYMMGLIGFILFEGFFVLIFLKCIKNITNSTSIDKKILYISLFSGILYMWIISMFGNIIEPPYSVMLLWLLVGVLFASEKIPENQQD